MFTGIIEELGEVEAFERHRSGARIKVRANIVLSDLEVGGSIAVNGVCLTATETTKTSFAADLSPETLERTTLAGLKTGGAVNLERPLSPAGRLSGHFVQGHVDGAGELVSLEPVGDGNWLLRIRAPRELLRFFVYKGSIAIDGISLTLAEVDDDLLSVAIIPHTYEVTTLRDLRPGDAVNLECDMIAKHIEKLLRGMHIEPEARLTVEDLKKQGF
jgi:riboflavin synthase